VHPCVPFWVTALRPPILKTTVVRMTGGEELPDKIGNAIGVVVIVLLFTMFFYAYSGIFG